MNLNRFLISCICAFLAGCTRGESNTVEQVLDASRQAYQVALGQPTAELQGKLSPVVTAIEKVASGEASKTEAQGLSDTLLDLVNHAGYTQRPSFTEIAYSLRESELKDPQSKVIASRMYRLLAAEMASTRFGL